MEMKLRKLSLFIVTLVMMSLMFSITAFAAFINGEVVDSQGNPMKKGTVTLESKENDNQSKSLPNCMNGHFSFFYEEGVVRVKINGYTVVPESVAIDGSYTPDSLIRFVAYSNSEQIPESRPEETLPEPETNPVEQAGSSLTEGTIMDENQNPLAGVTVYFTSDKSTGAMTISDDSGYFVLYNFDRNCGTLTFSKAGYTFEPSSYRIDSSYQSEIRINARSEAAGNVQDVPKTEATGNTVHLYFMTGSSPDTPGEVFEQFEVAKNSRGNTTTLAKTIGSKKPLKDGYTFDHWQEGKLSDPSVLGNRINTVIWTNEIDQYIYAQYRKSESTEPDTDSAEVILYKDKNFGGKSLALKAGEYKMGQLSKVGNDAISSLKVPEGYTVTLYADNNFKGRTLTCTSDISWLGDNNFNDITSSIIITKN